MANPITLQWPLKCEGCEKDIQKDEPTYFTDKGKLCIKCASDNGYVCDCGNYKKPDFAE